MPKISTFFKLVTFSNTLRSSELILDPSEIRHHNTTQHFLSVSEGKLFTNAHPSDPLKTFAGGTHTTTAGLLSKRRFATNTVYIIT